MNDAPLGFRTAPHNVDSEQAVLGAVLVNNGAYRAIAGFLRPEHFYEPVHGRLYAASSRLIESGRIADHVTLKVAFDEDEALRELDGAQYLARLARAAETIINAEDYAKHVHELAVRRALIHAGEALVNKAYDGTDPATAADQLEAARAHLDQLARDVPAPVAMVDWQALAGRKAPPRTFVLPHWIPAQCVTLLHGFGGIGKSLVAQQIGTVAALKRDFLGETADACPVLGWFGEDDHDELWRRQEAINSLFGIAGMAELQGRLHWRPAPGDDITMFSQISETECAPTAQFGVLRAQLFKTRARLTILDSATQIAAVSEISRPLVTRCLQSLNNLCIETGTTILLIGHNNRTGDFSGSSAWENRARSRIHMKRETADDGTESIKLCRPKANYAATEDGVALEWHEGAYRCTDQRFETYGDRLEREMREREIDQAFLAALGQLSEQRRNTSASRNAQNYAPKIMAEADMVNGFARRDLERSMNRLFKAGEIVADAKLWQKDDRHWATGIARK